MISDHDLQNSCLLICRCWATIRKNLNKTVPWRRKKKLRWSHKMNATLAFYFISYILSERTVRSNFLPFTLIQYSAYMLYISLHLDWIIKCLTHSYNTLLPLNWTINLPYKFHIISELLIGQSVVYASGTTSGLFILWDLTMSIQVKLGSHFLYRFLAYITSLCGFLLLSVLTLWFYWISSL